jgi:hypothetical protein
VRFIELVTPAPIARSAAWFVHLIAAGTAGWWHHARFLEVVTWAPAGTAPSIVTIIAAAGWCHARIVQVITRATSARSTAWFVHLIAAGTTGWCIQRIAAPTGRIAIIAAARRGRHHARFIQVVVGGRRHLPRIVQGFTAPTGIGIVAAPTVAAAGGIRIIPAAWWRWH